VALLACAALALALGAAAPAQAGEVHVEEVHADPNTPVQGSFGPTPSPQNETTLAFAAAAGEANQVTITRAAEAEGVVQLLIVDGGAPLTAGPGCSGGGGPGAPVTCALQAPRSPTIGACGHDCEFYVPASGWMDSIRAELGDGDNSFDASGLSGRFEKAYAMEVTGGDGADTIATASGGDEIRDGGGGGDMISTGAGYDRVLAAAAADGPDSYDLGPDGFDLVSYAARTAPVAFAASSGGAPGEGDRLADVEFLIGGAGDDVLEGGALSAIHGGPGDDAIIGGEGREWLDGEAGEDLVLGGGGPDELSGNDGDDVVRGGPGDDRILEEPAADVEEVPTTYGTVSGVTDGEDVAFGGPGDDMIRLGPEDDRAYGGGGEDALFGAAGRDRLRAGPGDDTVGGEEGSDRLWGGPGDDALLSGLTSEYRYAGLPRAMDGWRDVVECGGGADTSDANRWDATRECEGFHRVHVAKVDSERQLPGGELRLVVKVQVAGELSLTGAGIEAVTAAAPPVSYRHERKLALTVRPRGGALEALRLRGRVRVEVRLRFAPQDGVARAEALALTLTRGA
jgi:Ca2+-binding RTX toxin-like protein